MRAVLVAIALCLGGCVEGEFVCDDDVDCGAGVCEGNGYCSFTDEDCASGRRFGEAADQESAGRCVDEDAPSEQACLPSPAQGGCPADCPGQCDAGICVITCATTGACEDAAIVCPRDWPCDVVCNGLGACERLDMRCSDASCELTCNGLGTCRDAAVTCGGGLCDISCPGSGAGPLVIDCGSSCGCDRSCAL